MAHITGKKEMQETIVWLESMSSPSGVKGIETRLK